MKSLGIAIKKNEVRYGFAEGSDKETVVILETGRQNYRFDSQTLMMDFNNIFTELITKYKPDVVSYKLSLDLNMAQIPYMHYSLGVLNYVCLERGIPTIERSSRWITTNKSAKIKDFNEHFPDKNYKNEELAAALIAWYGIGE